MTWDLFRYQIPCGRVRPCGQYAGASTTCRYVCSRCWCILGEQGEFARDVMERYASCIADVYGPGAGAPPGEEAGRGE